MAEDYAPGGELARRWEASLPEIEAAHPVEMVDRPVARRVLSRLGLELPSEAQWEHGARAGTRSPWSCPADELGKHANIGDRTYGARFSREVAPEPWSDGFAYHAPVGSFLPNAFVPHDVHGNVMEWCLDGFEHDFYAHSPERDPVAPVLEGAFGVLGGGSHLEARQITRSALRAAVTPALAAPYSGIRPSREVVRDEVGS